MDIAFIGEICANLAGSRQDGAAKNCQQEDFAGVLVNIMASLNQENIATHLAVAIAPETGYAPEDISIQATKTGFAPEDISSQLEPGEVAANHAVPENDLQEHESTVNRDVPDVESKTESPAGEGRGVRPRAPDQKPAEASARAPDGITEDRRDRQAQWQTQVPLARAETVSANPVVTRLAALFRQELNPGRDNPLRLEGLVPEEEEPAADTKVSLRFSDGLGRQVREIVSEVKREDLPWQSQRREDRPAHPVMPAKEMQQKFTAEFFATEARPVEVKGDYAKIMTPVYEEIQLRQGQKDGSGEIRVRLVPDSLGEVVIHLSRQDGRITGRVTVENAFVRDAIEANLSQLRERLAQQEITLSQLNVFVGNESREWGSRRGANAVRRQNAPVVMPAVADVSRNPAGIPTGKLDVLA